MKVLVGYDGSDCAKAAIEDLVLAGLPADVDARLLSVADMLVKVPYEDYLELPEAENGPTARLVRTARALAADEMRQAQEAAVEGVGMLGALFPGWRVSSHAVADSPYWALVRTAEQWGADLVVVGSHGRAALGRLFLGSVSQNVLGHAACSVRVARTRERLTATPPRVIVGVDGSSIAQLAVDGLARRNWPDGTEVRVVTAIDRQLAMAVAFYAACPSPAGLTGDVVSAARNCARSAADRLTAAGLCATTVVEEGDPKGLLVEQARDWPADCVFLGARGHRQLERFVLGSVSASVAARAPCTVEVVRALRDGGADRAPGHP